MECTGMSDPKAFDKILTEIIRQDKGIKKVILVDKTGLTIANVSKLSYYRSSVRVRSRARTCRLGSLR
jgi:predicted regulator of Ras-like GTPase activity (Roadblock/LC7/MglB family)